MAWAAWSSSGLPGVQHYAAWLMKGRVVPSPLSSFSDSNSILSLCCFNLSISDFNCSAKRSITRSSNNLYCGSWWSLCATESWGGCGESQKGPTNELSSS
ncbi:hypothetical protein Pyn_06435 [Prunus yedoensis var. nudiflora]|uniref:Uncharacterized protein n=1 Tax=Prunus yedoensis var. nudiflora TaxID=2094558 RepID=A0A314UP67_PRUYE|nr:hypothetical protein Pyn_06435 [Prunus yedoensis var. nudiflora]